MRRDKDLNLINLNNKDKKARTNDIETSQLIYSANHLTDLFMTRHCSGVYY